MHSVCRFLPILGLVAGLRADAPPTESLLCARRAAAMLGPVPWKRVIVIQNSGAGSRYPRSLGALVFEMGGILWFYTSADGTQSLSLQLGQADLDEENLGGLLPNIDPGFTRWEYDLAGECAELGGPTPPNACFIECIKLLHGRLASGAEADRPRLLSYYVALPEGVRGHTVLFFRTRNGPMIIDPLHPKKRYHVRPRLPDDARSVASCLRGDIASARWVPVCAETAGNRLDAAKHTVATSSHVGGS